MCYLYKFFWFFNYHIIVVLGYIVTFTKVLTIYHSWIHSLHSSLHNFLFIVLWVLDNLFIFLFFEAALSWDNIRVSITEKNISLERLVILGCLKWTCRLKECNLSEMILILCLAEKMLLIMYRRNVWDEFLLIWQGFNVDSYFHCCVSSQESKVSFAFSQRKI
jgi:hypothetical protein